MVPSGSQEAELKLTVSGAVPENGVRLNDA